MEAMLTTSLPDLGNGLAHGSLRPTPPNAADKSETGHTGRTGKPSTAITGDNRSGLIFAAKTTA
jgi:hypothetical protein